MSMYDGLDLSRFKKIASDKNSSTLRHTKGHEIKIAHSGLTPKMREHLTGMPVHLAGGGGPGGDSPVSVDPESPAQVSDVPPKPANVPVVGNVDVNGLPPPPKPSVAQELDNEDGLYAQDLARGHIKPETMSDLFAKKDTMGKIGTIFGLIVGGAGAGLSHQPNALLAMMQKEIDNDLEAQKASNTDAQNWLKLSHDHELQKATLRKMGVENEYTRALTSKTGAEASMIPSEIGRNEAQRKSLEADVPLKATQAAEARMKLTILQDLFNQGTKMPPGPGRDQYFDKLDNVVKPAVLNDISQKNQKVQGQLDARAALRGDLLSQPPQDTSGTGVDLEKMTKLANLAGKAAFVGAPGVIPGAMDQAAVGAARQEAAHVAENRAIASMFVASFNRLDKAFRGGVLNPNLRDAEIASLGQQMAQRIGNSTSQKEYERILGSMFPGPTDWGRTRDAKFNHGIAAFKALEAGTSTLDQFHLKTPFPEYAREKTQKKETVATGKTDKTPRTEKSPIADGTTGKIGDKSYVRKGGKWVPK